MVIILVFLKTSMYLNTLNIYNFSCQLYLSKAEEKKKRLGKKLVDGEFPCGVNCRQGPCL